MQNCPSKKLVFLYNFRCFKKNSLIFLNQEEKISKFSASQKTNFNLINQINQKRDEMSNKYDEVLRQNLALEKSVISLEKKNVALSKEITEVIFINYFIINFN